MSVDVKLSFKDFVDKYNSPETEAHARDIVPYVDGETLLEFYSYHLLVYDEATDKTIIVGHPDYMEVGIDAYLDFLLEMQKTINTKRAC